MPASNVSMIRRLQEAINRKGGKILLDKYQFFSEEQQRPISVYRIARSIFNDEKGKNVRENLFETTSQIQVVLYLRDYWYTMNGTELPTDNETWNDIREKKGLKFWEGENG